MARLADGGVSAVVYNKNNSHIKLDLLMLGQ